ADRGDLRRRDPERHLVLDEADNEKLQLIAGDLLLLDRRDLADAVSRVHDVLVGLETLTLMRGLLQSFLINDLLRSRLLRGLLGSGTGNRFLGIHHSARYLFTVRPAAGRLCFGSRATNGAP